MAHSFARRATAAAVLMAMANPNHAQQAEPAKLDTVTITAQKREQPLQDVPVSVTVIGADALRNAKIDSGAEIARQTPNLRVSVLGDESQPKFSLRGISTPEFNLNAISPTGIFFDEVYIGASYLGGPQIFDIERVEVLRGPQGTLFGKNTTAGAVNFISKRPTFRREGEITLGYGTKNLVEAKGAFEMPLADERLSVRVAFAGAHSNGYIENLNPAGRDLSSIDRQAARVTVGYRDDPNGFDATLRLFTSTANPRAIGAINEGTSDGVTPSIFGTVTPAGTNLYGINPRTNPLTGAPLSSTQVVTDRSADIQVRGNGGYLTMNKDLGFGTLTSITSFVSGRFSNLVDADGTIAPLLHINFASKSREFSQDLRIASAFRGPFQAIVGVYHQRDDIDVDTDYFLFGGSPAASSADQSYSQKRKSYAAYADGTYDITKTIQAYGGLRYTRDEGRMSNYQILSTGVVPSVLPPVADITYNDSAPTGRLGLSAKLSPDLMVFGQYARGYRSSAINGGLVNVASQINVAKPEHLNAFEVGVKSQWLDRALTVNVSAFRYEFTDQQFLNVLGIGNQQLVNAGRSRIQGVEIETFIRPAKNFTLAAGAGLLDAKYRELSLTNAALVTANLSGKRMIEAPNYTANLAADYSVPVQRGYVLNFHVDATFVGGQYFTPYNDPLSRIGSFTDVGARVSVRAPSGKYEVALYGKNLTNNHVPTGLALDPSTETKFMTVPYPRRFGVEVTARF